jgi:integrase
MNSSRGAGSIYRRGEIVWIKYYRDRRCYRESSGSTKESEARKLLKRRLGEISAGRFMGPAADKVTIRELAQDFENDYRVNGKKSLDRAQRAVQQILRFFGGCRAHDVSTDVIRKYTAKRLEENAANATINRELAALKRMYRLGLQAERINRRPHIPMLQENNVRRGFFEYAEFLALRAALPDYLKPVVTFAYYTGCRKGEILSLGWSQVDLEGRTVRIDPGTTKTGEGRVIALEGELLDVLRGQWERRKVAEIPGRSPTLLCSFVFHRDGKVIGDFRDSWATACKDAMLAGKLFHDLRRTAVRNMVRAGVHERVAMKVSGHKTRSVFDRYNIVTEADIKDAAHKVWSYAQSLSRLRILGTVQAQGDKNRDISGAY